MTNLTSLHRGNSTNDENERLRDEPKRCPCEGGIGRWVCVGTGKEEEQDDGDEDEDKGNDESDEDEQDGEGYVSRDRQGEFRGEPANAWEKEGAGPRDRDWKRRHVGARCGKGSRTGRHNDGRKQRGQGQKIMIVALCAGGSCLGCVLLAVCCLLCKRRAIKPKPPIAGPVFGRTAKDEQIVVGTVFDPEGAKTDNANLDLEMGA